MSATVTCPQCQAGLRIQQDLSANQMVSCPHCKLKFVPPAPAAAGGSGGSFLPWLLLAVVVGLGIGGVAWNNFANQGREDKAADNKPAAIAQTSTNKQPSNADTNNAGTNTQGAAPKTIDAASETQPPKSPIANGNEAPDPPKPMPQKAPNKKAPKTYAQTKQALDNVPPPAVENKTPLLSENKPPPPVGVKPPTTEKKTASPAAVDPPTVKSDHPKQQQINDAIEKGVAFLKREQLASGSWPMQPGGNNAEFIYDVGYAALGGLTLLECKVPATDPAVKKAAVYVRSTPVRDRRHRNYQISCVILFLDKLGDPRDRRLIQAYALELVAGQNARGAWTYESPSLTGPEMQQLLSFLEATRLPGLDAHPMANDPPSGKAAGEDPAQPQKKQPAPKKASGKPPAFGKLSRNVAAIPLVYNWYFPGKAKAHAGPGNLTTVPPNAPGQPNAPVPAQPLVPGQPNLVPGAPGLLMGNMEDNSNTQFAMLALWAARRHGVPTERCFVAAGQHFFSTQMPDGGWTYMGTMGLSTPAMTSVGLLGLAMAQGVTPTKEGDKGQLPDVPAIAKGLYKLSDHVEEKSMRDLYYLWSLERVGMLYNLKTIGHKNWYDLAADMLLEHQRDDGRWAMHSYLGSCASLDTFFALLVLKRSNLVQDLTERLPFLMSIPDRTPSKP